MSKKEERARIAEAITSNDPIKACEESGFTVCSTSEESVSKKKATV